MLVKETGPHKDYTISLLSAENVNTEGSSAEVNKDSDGPLKSDSSNVLEAHFAEKNNRNGGGNEDVLQKSSSDKGCTVPVDYQLLPEEFFPVEEDIPPPLVSKAWLALLYDDESFEQNLITQCTNNALDRLTDEEDSIPLAKLITKYKTDAKNKEDISPELGLHNSRFNDVHLLNYKTNIKKSTDGKRQKPKKCKTIRPKSKECYLINRKRGRPRKSEKSIQNSNVEMEFWDSINDTSKNEDDENFWNNQTDPSNVDMSFQDDDEKEDSSSVIINYREHDYFKQADNDCLSRNECEDSKNIKKRKSGIQGVKNEDLKMSFPCLDCGKSFSAASTLRNHQRIHNGTLLKCTECHKGFTTKYLLKCHMRIHNGDLFMCHKCGKGFTTAELLKVHSRGHTGDRPFMCNVCGRSFPSASNLSQHKQTHDSEKKFLCFQCGSSFSQKRCLDGHMLTHAEKNHICNVCGKLWARKSDLIEHMRVHTGVKPYCCRMCPQKFTQASSLKRHQIVHMDVKPIQCLTCSKIFKCQEYYKRHVKKHEKEADYLFNNLVKDK